MSTAARLLPALLILTAAFASGCGAGATAAKPTPAPPPGAPQVSVQPGPTAETPSPAPPRGGTLSVGPAPKPEEEKKADVDPIVPKTLPARPLTAIAQATAPSPSGPQRFVVFNFDNADLEVVVQAASEIVGFNYVIAPAARGRKVTVQTTGRIPSDEVFSVLLTVLDVNGLAAVRTGSLYRIIPREGAAQAPLRTVIGRDLEPAVSADEVLTQIVPLQYINASDAVTLLRPFAASPGALTAHRETNLLIITDTAANIRRLLDILKLTDVQVALEELKIIPVKHADAQEMATLLTQIFASGRVRPPGAPGAPPAPAVPGPPAAARPPGAEGAASTDKPPLIVAERRSNSVIVNASKPEMETIRRLIEQLDVDIYGGQRVFIYFVENTKAKDLAATLDAIFGKGAGPAVTGSPAAPGGPGLPPPGGRVTIPPASAPPVPAAPRASIPAGAPGAGPEAGLAGPGGEVRFIADEVTNAIIVNTYPRSWKDIEETIRKLDKMPRQVLIEVLAAEVTLDDSMRLGIEWAIRSGRFDANFGFRSAGAGLAQLGPRPPSDLFIKAVGTVIPGLNFFTFATEQFMSALNALAIDNKVNVLSNPSIMTAENKKAVINVSRSVPILTSQQAPLGGTAPPSSISFTTQTVEYRDAGIILTVTPRIGEQGTVALDVKQEVNDVGDPVPPTNSPEFKKREAETSVVLVNNQTLVMGGLIQNRRTVVRTGIPILNKIPLLGLLFGATSERIEKTELVLLITPRVIGTAIDAARITDQMRKVTPEIKESFDKAARPPVIGPKH